MKSDFLLRGGEIVDGSIDEARRADLLVKSGRIAEVIDPVRSDDLAGRSAREVIDCAGRLVMPGFVDAHSHADAAVFDPQIQLALLRQGVTTVIAGQDGVSYAPGDGAYASEYFAALLGPHPTYSGGGVRDLLATYDDRTRVNVAYLVPHGTVRHQILGFARRPATESELAQISELIAAGMMQGAVGLSTGLDYVPGLFADTAELTNLCDPVAQADGVYVTHMRGGYESNSKVGIDEVRAIAQASGVRAHISHFHGPPQLMNGLVAEAIQAGIDLTFDAYPYRAGFTLLSMPLLPANLLALGPHEVAAHLLTPTTREHLLREWLPSVGDEPELGSRWPSRLTLGHVAARDYQWAEGLTIAEASTRSGKDPNEFVLDVLAASHLEVSAIMPVPTERSVDDLAMLIRHDRHMLGSDGIYIGSHPHPRGWGSFTRFLARHVRERADLGWAQAAAHLSSAPVTRFHLGDRGLIRPGYVADLIVVDPQNVTDEATYERPRTLSQGIHDVFVAGMPVLRHGELTEHLPGRGLRQELSTAHVTG